MEKHSHLSFQHPSRSLKLFNEKENEHKHVNKKTDLLATLQNIKLPSYESISNQRNFQSINLTSSVNIWNRQSITHRPILQQPIIKKSDTQQFCLKYGETLSEVFSSTLIPKSFLQNHKIDGTLRARMLDWMVQVMAMYKFQHKTYFAGVQIMDKYFENEKQVILPSSLHLIGVEAMLIASKMEEVYPLKVKTVFDKIAHKKIPMKELIQMEAKISQVLNFQLSTFTVYDSACLKIVDYLVSENLYEALQSSIKEVEDVLSCLAKYMVYSYEIVHKFSKNTQAKVLSSLVLDAFKINVGERERDQERGRWQLQTFLQGEYQQFRECKMMLIETINAFKQKFRGLQNLSKFTSKTVMERLEVVIL